MSLLDAASDYRSALERQIDVLERERARLLVGGMATLIHLRQDLSVRCAAAAAIDRAKTDADPATTLTIVHRPS